MQSYLKGKKGFTRLNHRLEAVSVNCPTGTVLEY